MTATDQMIFRERARQASWVQHEVAELMRVTAANQGGMGIHKTQADALGVFMEELDARVATALGTLHASPGDPIASRDFVVQLVGRGEVWQVFRTVFLARRDVLLTPMLDLADMVAARAYLRLQDQAIAWNTGIVARPPPLVVLRAATGAAAAGAQHTLKALTDSGFLLRKLRDEPLPISIVMLSAEQCASAWRMVSLFHEVGHLLDASLEVSTEMRELSVTHALGGFDGGMFRANARELVADVIGVALGGDAFVASLAYDLFELLPSFGEIDPSDPHPNPWIRLPLLFEIAAAFGVTPLPTSWTLHADFLALSPPAWAVAPRAALGDVAAFLVKTKLSRLKDHSLMELARPWAAVAPGLAKLVGYFVEAGKLGRFPVRAKQEGIDWDLLPIAAERARVGGAAWDALHADVLAYARDYLERPQQLASAAGNPIPAWKNLAKAFRFDGVGR